MNTGQKILRSLFWILLLLASFGLGHLHYSPSTTPLISPTSHEDGLFAQQDKTACDSACCNPSAPGHGRWHKINESATLTQKQQDQIKALQTISYASGSVPAPQNTKIITYDATRCEPGLNLYISGHAPMAILMDMEGKELHRWSYDVAQIWPKYKKEIGQSYWRRVHLFENGDLLAIYDGVGLIKLNKKSELLWSYGRGAHHDLFVTKEGLIYLLTRQAHILPKYHKTEPILEDFICILDAQGKELRQVSVLKALENSSYAPLLRQIEEAGDIFHTNTIEWVDSRLISRLPDLKEGQILISLLRLDTIAVVDLDLKKVVWALSGLWHRQHQPTVLEQGRILIFDNRGFYEKSRVFEFDPLTQTIFWEYRGSPEQPFYSYDCGSCARLPNGNTLITETNKGRVFEVTPSKEIVWEFLNPNRAGPNQDLIAAVFELLRLPANFPIDWIKN